MPIPSASDALYGASIIIAMNVLRATVYISTQVSECLRRRCGRTYVKCVLAEHCCQGSSRGRDCRYACSGAPHDIITSVQGLGE